MTRRPPARHSRVLARRQLQDPRVGRVRILFRPRADGGRDHQSAVGGRAGRLGIGEGRLWFAFRPARHQHAKIDRFLTLIWQHLDRVDDGADIFRIDPVDQFGGLEIAVAIGGPAMAFLRPAMIVSAETGGEPG